MNTLSICCLAMGLILSSSSSAVYAMEKSSEIINEYPDFVEITLEQAIGIVSDIHPDLKEQEIAIEKARQEVRLAKKAFFPNIDVDYIASSASGGLGLILTASRILRPIFSLKSLIADRKIKEILQEKEYVIKRLRELEVIYGMKELYVALLIQERLIKYLKTNEKVGQENFEREMLRHKEGQITDAELLDEELKIYKAREQSQSAETMYLEAILIFKDLLKLDPSIPIRLSSREVPLEEAFPLSLDDCFMLASHVNPFVHSIRLEASASLEELGKRKSKFLIDSIFLSTGDAAHFFEEDSSKGISGNAVLYDWGKTKIKNELQYLSHEEVLMDHRKKLKQLEEMITRNYFDLIMLDQAIFIARKKLDIADEKKRREKTLMAVGRSTIKDLKEAEEKLSLASMDLWKKHMEYFLTRERLLKNLGFSTMTELMEVKPR